MSIVKASSEIAQFQTITVRQRPSSRILAIGAALFIITIALFLQFGTYTRRVTASGILSPATGIIRMRTATPGHVSEIFVKEGQLVRKGQPLLTLEDSRGMASATSQLAQIKPREARRLTEALTESMGRRDQAMVRERASRQAVARQDLLALDAQLKQGEQELAAAVRIEKLSRKRAAESLQQTELFDDLANKGYYSNTALYEKRDLAASLQVAAADAARNVDTLKRQLVTLEASRSQIITKTDLDLTQIDQRLALMQQDSLELSNRTSSVLVAPIDGRVTGVLVDVGIYVERQIAATIVPNDVELMGFLYVPSRAIGFIRSGQTVNLRYEAFPYQKFGVQEGRVVDVSLAQIAPDQIPENLPVQSREGLYRVTVALKKQSIRAYQENKPLIAGMVVEADLLQESRTLIEWILEPLIATTARLAASKTDK